MFGPFHRIASSNFLGTAGRRVMLAANESGMCSALPMPFKTRFGHSPAVSVSMVPLIGFPPDTLTPDPWIALPQSGRGQP